MALKSREFVISLYVSSNAIYGKCFKILNTFIFLFSNKILIIRAGTHRMLVRIANRVDPYQTASLLIWVCAVCLGFFGRHPVFEIFRTLTVITRFYLQIQDISSWLVHVQCKQFQEPLMVLLSWCTMEQL